MASLNQCTFMGNMGKDPEVRYLPDGTAAASISVGVSEKWKDKQTGEQKERTEWVRATAMGKLAEIIGEYGSKGMQVLIQGKMRTNKYQDSSGNDKYSTEIRLDKWLMLGSKGQSNQQDGGQRSQERPVSDAPNEFDQFDDDIPF